jgi:hypothetical protein
MNPPSSPAASTSARLSGAPSSPLKQRLSLLAFFLLGLAFVVSSLSLVFYLAQDGLSVLSSARRLDVLARQVGSVQRQISSCADSGECVAALSGQTSTRVDLSLLSAAAMPCLQTACPLLGDEDGRAGESAPWKGYYRVKPDGSIVLYAESAAGGGFDAMELAADVSGERVSWHPQPMGSGQTPWQESSALASPPSPPSGRAAR